MVEARFFNLFKLELTESVYYRKQLFLTSSILRYFILKSPRTHTSAAPLLLEKGAEVKMKLQDLKLLIKTTLKQKSIIPSKLQLYKNRKKKYPLLCIHQSYSNLRICIDL